MHADCRSELTHKLASKCGSIVGAQNAERKKVYSDSINAMSIRMYKTDRFFLPSTSDLSQTFVNI